MNKFSLNMSLEEMEKEIFKALGTCFKLKLEIPSRDVLICLKMIDRILPQNLPKMMHTVLKKHF